MGNTIIRTLFGAKPSDSSGQRPQDQKDRSNQSKLSLKELFKNCEARNGLSKIVALGIYLRDYQDTESFTADDIKNWFPKAAEKVPGNINRDLKSTIGQGWIAHTTGDATAYYVTTAGEEAYAAKFPGTKAASSKGKTKKKT